MRAAREALGLTQAALAAAVGLSRQSVGAIEAGRATPAVDVALRLARALGRPVEALFGGGGGERLPVELVAPAPSGRVALAEVGGRWRAYPLEGEGPRLSADALAPAGGAAQVEVELLRPREALAGTVVLLGCAAALGLVADRLSARAGAGRFLWLGRSSTAAVAALVRGEGHVAGVHLIDEASGEANLPDVRRLAGGAALVVITLARWEAGLVVAAGNPRRIRGAQDLGRRGLRVISREPGSGARRLLERELRREGLEVDLAGRGRVQARSHLEVAQAVAIGAGDVGVATRDAAIAQGLGFVPLAEERYDLVIPRALDGDPRIDRLLDAMSGASVRRELAPLGYDLRPCGERVAEIAAA
ncbi:MAG: substrate-binding domain-containing protein [Nannocystaceae bacterium]